MWGLSELKDIFKVLDQLVMFFSMSEEREKDAACLSEGLEISRQMVESSANNESGFSRESERSFMKIRYRMGPRTLP